MTKRYDSQNKSGFYDGADGSIKMIADIIEKAKLTIGVVDAERCGEVNSAYSILADYYKYDESVEVSCSFSESLKNMAVISIEGSALFFSAPDILINAAKFANNIDICSKSNGCVSFELTFYGLVK